MNRKENKLKFSLNGLTPVLDFLHARIVPPLSLIGSVGSIFSLPGLAIAPSVRKSATRSSKFAIKKMLGELRTAALPRCERANAFTLAEVLITLGVIGVVAAMTLPTVINEHRISQWETALKRDYTVLSQGFRKIMADYGCDTLECTGIFSANSSDEEEVNIYLNNIDNAVRSTFQVVNTYKNGDGHEVKFLKVKFGGSETTLWQTTYSFTLNDGSLVYFGSSGTCKPFGNTKYCSYILIDVNGKVKPNTFGKDIFVLGHLLNDGTIIPDCSSKWVELTEGNNNYWRNAPGQCGTPNTKLKDETISQISGQNCLARIMENNWKMDYLH